MSKDKVVLAYSGGLDTSCILKWLIDKGYDVYAFVGDVGQEDDFEEVAKNALAIGAKEVFVENLQREFVTDYIIPAVQWNALYESRYFLGTALARPLIAKRQIEIAMDLGARYVAHGSTGKGNDQVRFELAYWALAPNIEIIAPWKDQEFLDTFKGRPDLIAYAKKHGIPVPVTLEKPFSTDENLMHKSYEAGILEDPMFRPDKDMFKLTVDPKDAPDEETRLEIHFKDGFPVKLVNLDDGTEKTDPYELFVYLNDVARKNGVGRVDMVENRFIGIKSRGVYETPGATILYHACRDIEGIAMDREVQHLRDMLAPKLAEIIYYGYWFSPEMDFLMAAFQKSQELIDGKVVLSVYKGNVIPIGRWSPNSLYDQELASMDIEGGFDQKDSFGFIKLKALRLRAHRAIVREAD